MTEIFHRHGDAFKEPWEDDLSHPSLLESVLRETGFSKTLCCDTGVAFLAPGGLDELILVDEINWKDRGSSESRETHREYKCAGDKLWNFGTSRGIPTGLSRKAAGRNNEDLTRELEEDMRNVGQQYGDYWCTREL